jgi:type I restriction enzyme S subunit
MTNEIRFYKETNFKETPIGKIPKDWGIVKVCNLFDLYKGTTPSSKIKEYWDGNIPFVTPTDITNINDSNEMYLKTTENYISETGLKSKGLKLVPGNSLLFTSRATIGYLAINEIEAAINQGIISLIPKNKTVDVTFFYYLLQRLRDLFESLAGGSTYKEISMSTFSNLSISFPPLLEQQKISEILSTVDEAIQKTNEIIAKTERLKKGLMQELLTKGIGHKEFKDTEIGRIPKEWEIKKLKDVCMKITDGSHWSPKEIEKSDYRIASVTNLKELYIDVNSCKFISEEDYAHLVREGDVPEKGDVLFSKDGTVGICFTFKQSNYKIGVLSSIAIIKPDHQFLYSDFLAYALKSPNVVWQIIGRKTGTALTRIILDNLKTVKIPIPSLEEQQKIADILLTVDEKLKLERNEKTRLEKIKQGLMDLLLTGKIRVKV